MGALLTAAAMCSHQYKLEDYLPEVTRLLWTSTDLQLDPDDQRRKLAALAEYTSQVTAFGGMPTLEAFLRQVHVALDSCDPSGRAE